MARTVKSLSGAAKDAHLARALAGEPELSPEAAERLARRLGGEVTRIWVRIEALAADAAPGENPEDEAGPATDGFDPFTPNVIVLLRTRGRADALAALEAIARTDRLRLLAREQQLGIDAGLSAPDEIRSAIIAAAERRIANRRAAAS